MKRIFSALITFLLLVSISLPGLASSTSAPPDVSPTLTYSYGSWSMPMGIMALDTALAISGVNYGITKFSSTSVHATASTSANQTADYVGGTMYLQKWVNSAWSSIASRSFGASLATQCADAITWTVASGYYYRLRTVHIAELDTESVTRTTYTNSILVN